MRKGARLTLFKGPAVTLTVYSSFPRSWRAGRRGGAGGVGGGGELLQEVEGEVERIGAGEVGGGGGLLEKGEGELDKLTARRSRGRRTLVGGERRSREVKGQEKYEEEKDYWRRGKES